ncbi:hypothetical protein GCM10010275_48440 [Streptomyces litmocidini]|uniref:hypothetical protein n=1 Tax=Streptomyces litmocidini TaxID=67318 RepID=UPI00167CB5BD|nr:hypothetical protein [Streptomyces litmocidini]GGV03405.1 hypothetical protein GCM10010275_48440 [Streptomyces litmocidini]
MADLNPTNPLAAGEEIVSKNMHATDAPLTDAVAEKLGLSGNMHATAEPIDAAAGTATTDNMHATSEPAN